MFDFILWIQYNQQESLGHMFIRCIWFELHHEIAIFCGLAMVSLDVLNAYYPQMDNMFAGGGSIWTNNPYVSKDTDATWNSYFIWILDLADRSSVHHYQNCRKNSWISYKCVFESSVEYIVYTYNESIYVLMRITSYANAKISSDDTAEIQI